MEENNDVIVKVFKVDYDPGVELKDLTLFYMRHPLDLEVACLDYFKYTDAESDFDDYLQNASEPFFQMDNTAGEANAWPDQLPRKTSVSAGAVRNTKSKKNKLANFGWGSSSEESNSSDDVILLSDDDSDEDYSLKTQKSFLNFDRFDLNPPFRTFPRVPSLKKQQPLNYIDNHDYGTICLSDSDSDEDDRPRRPLIRPVALNKLQNISGVTNSPLCRIFDSRIERKPPKKKFEPLPRLPDSYLEGIAVCTRKKPVTSNSVRTNVKQQSSDFPKLTCLANFVDDSPRPYYSPIRKALPLTRSNIREDGFLKKNTSEFCRNDLKPRLSNTSNFLVDDRKQDISRISSTTNTEIENRLFSPLNSSEINPPFTTSTPIRSNNNVIEFPSSSLPEPIKNELTDILPHVEKTSTLCSLEVINQDVNDLDEKNIVTDKTICDKTMQQSDKDDGVISSSVTEFSPTLDVSAFKIDNISNKTLESTIINSVLSNRDNVTKNDFVSETKPSINKNYDLLQIKENVNVAQKDGQIHRNVAKDICSLNVSEDSEKALGKANSKNICDKVIGIVGDFNKTLPVPTSLDKSKSCDVISTDVNIFNSISSKNESLIESNKKSEEVTNKNSVESENICEEFQMPVEETEIRESDTIEVTDNIMKTKDSSVKHVDESSDCLLNNEIFITENISSAKTVEEVKSMSEETENLAKQDDLNSDVSKISVSKDKINQENLMLDANLISVNSSFILENDLEISCEDSKLAQILPEKIPIKTSNEFDSHTVKRFDELEIDVRKNQLDAQEESFEVIHSENENKSKDFFIKSNVVDKSMITPEEKSISNVQNKTNTPENLIFETKHSESDDPKNILSSCENEVSSEKQLNKNQDEISEQIADIMDTTIESAIDDNKISSEVNSNCDKYDNKKETKKLETESDDSKNIVLSEDSKEDQNELLEPILDNKEEVLTDKFSVDANIINSEVINIFSKSEVEKKLDKKSDSDKLEINSPFVCSKASTGKKLNKKIVNPTEISIAVEESIVTDVDSNSNKSFSQQKSKRSKKLDKTLENDGLKMNLSSEDSKVSIEKEADQNKIQGQNLDNISLTDPKNILSSEDSKTFTENKLLKNLEEEDRMSKSTIAIKSAVEENIKFQPKLILPSEESKELAGKESNKNEILEQSVDIVKDTDCAINSTSEDNKASSEKVSDTNLSNQNELLNQTVEKELDQNIENIVVDESIIISEVDSNSNKFAIKKKCKRTKKSDNDISKIDLSLGKNKQTEQESDKNKMSESVNKVATITDDLKMILPPEDCKNSSKKESDKNEISEQDVDNIIATADKKCAADEITIVSEVNICSSESEIKKKSRRSKSSNKKSESNSSKIILIPEDSVVAVDDKDATTNIKSAENENILTSGEGSTSIRNEIEKESLKSESLDKKSEIDVSNTITIFEQNKANSADQNEILEQNADNKAATSNIKCEEDGITIVSKLNSCRSKTENEKIRKRTRSSDKRSQNEEAKVSNKYLEDQNLLLKQNEDNIGAITDIKSVVDENTVTSVKSSTSKFETKSTRSTDKKSEVHKLKNICSTRDNKVFIENESEKNTKHQSVLLDKNIDAIVLNSDLKHKGRINKKHNKNLENDISKNVLSSEASKGVTVENIVKSLIDQNENKANVEEIQSNIQQIELLNKLSLEQSNNDKEHSNEIVSSEDKSLDHTNAYENMSTNNISSKSVIRKKGNRNKKSKNNKSQSFSQVVEDKNLTENLVNISKPQAIDNNSGRIVKNQEELAIETTFESKRNIQEINEIITEIIVEDNCVMSSINIDKQTEKTEENSMVDNLQLPLNISDHPVISNDGLNVQSIDENIKVNEIVENVFDSNEAFSNKIIEENELAEIVEEIEVPEKTFELNTVNDILEEINCDEILESIVPDNQNKVVEIAQEVESDIETATLSAEHEVEINETENPMNKIVNDLVTERSISKDKIDIELEKNTNKILDNIKCDEIINAIVEPTAVVDEKSEALLKRNIKKVKNNSKRILKKNQVKQNQTSTCNGDVSLDNQDLLLEDAEAPIGAEEICVTIDDKNCNEILTVANSEIITNDIEDLSPVEIARKTLLEKIKNVQNEETKKNEPALKKANKKNRRTILTITTSECDVDESTYLTNKRVTRNSKLRGSKNVDEVLMESPDVHKIKDVDENKVGSANASKKNRKSLDDTPLSTRKTLRTRRSLEGISNKYSNQVLDSEVNDISAGSSLDVNNVDNTNMETPKRGKRLSAKRKEISGITPLKNVGDIEDYPLSHLKTIIRKNDTSPKDQIITPTTSTETKLELFKYVQLTPKSTELINCDEYDPLRFFSQVASNVDECRRMLKEGNDINKKHDEETTVQAETSFVKNHEILNDVTKEPIDNSRLKTESVSVKNQDLSNLKSIKKRKKETVTEKIAKRLTRDAAKQMIAEATELCSKTRNSIKKFDEQKQIIGSCALNSTEEVRENLIQVPEEVNCVKNIESEKKIVEENSKKAEKSEPQNFFILPESKNISAKQPAVKELPSPTDSKPVSASKKTMILRRYSSEFAKESISSSPVVNKQIIKQSSENKELINSDVAEVKLKDISQKQSDDVEISEIDESTDNDVAEVKLKGILKKQSDNMESPKKNVRKRSLVTFCWDDTFKVANKSSESLPQESKKKTEPSKEESEVSLEEAKLSLYENNKISEIMDLSISPLDKKTDSGVHNHIDIITSPTTSRELTQVKKNRRKSNTIFHNKKFVENEVLPDNKLIKYDSYQTTWENDLLSSPVCNKNCANVEVNYPNDMNDIVDLTIRADEKEDPIDYSSNSRVCGKSENDTTKTPEVKKNFSDFSIKAITAKKETTSKECSIQFTPAPIILSPSIKSSVTKASLKSFKNDVFDCKKIISMNADTELNKTQPFHHTTPLNFAVSKEDNKEHMFNGEVTEHNKIVPYVSPKLIFADKKLNLPLIPSTSQVVTAKIKSPKGNTSISKNIKEIIEKIPENVVGIALKPTSDDSNKPEIFSKLFSSKNINDMLIIEQTEIKNHLDAVNPIEFDKQIATSDKESSYIQDGNKINQQQDKVESDIKEDIDINRKKKKKTKKQIAAEIKNLKQNSVDVLDNKPRENITEELLAGNEKEEKKEKSIETKLEGVFVEKERSINLEKIEQDLNFGCERKELLEKDVISKEENLNQKSLEEIDNNKEIIEKKVMDENAISESCEIIAKQNDDNFVEETSRDKLDMKLEIIDNQIINKNVVVHEIKSVEQTENKITEETTKLDTKNSKPNSEKELPVESTENEIENLSMPEKQVVEVKTIEKPCIQFNEDFIEKEKPCIQPKEDDVENTLKTEKISAEVKIKEKQYIQPKENEVEKTLKAEKKIVEMKSKGKQCFRPKEDKMEKLYETEENFSEVISEEKYTQPAESKSKPFSRSEKKIGKSKTSTPSMKKPSKRETKIGEVKSVEICTQSAENEIDKSKFEPENNQSKHEEKIAVEKSAELCQKSIENETEINSELEKNIAVMKFNEQQISQLTQTDIQKSSKPKEIIEEIESKQQILQLNEHEMENTSESKHKKEQCAESSKKEIEKIFCSEENTDEFRFFSADKKIIEVKENETKEEIGEVKSEVQYTQSMENKIEKISEKNSIDVKSKDKNKIKKLTKAEKKIKRDKSKIIISKETKLTEVVPDKIKDNEINLKDDSKTLTIVEKKSEQISNVEKIIIENISQSAEKTQPVDDTNKIAIKNQLLPSVDEKSSLTPDLSSVKDSVKINKQLNEEFKISLPEEKNVECESVKDHNKELNELEAKTSEMLDAPNDKKIQHEKIVDKFEEEIISKDSKSEKNIDKEIDNQLISEEVSTKIQDDKKEEAANETVNVDECNLPAVSETKKVPKLEKKVIVIKSKLNLPGQADKNPKLKSVIDSKVLPILENKSSKRQETKNVKDESNKTVEESITKISKSEKKIVKNKSKTNIVDQVIKKSSEIPSEQNQEKTVKDDKISPMLEKSVVSHVDKKVVENILKVIDVPSDLKTIPEEVKIDNKDKSKNKVSPKLNKELLLENMQVARNEVDKVKSNTNREKRIQEVKTKVEIVEKLIETLQERKSIESQDVKPSAEIPLILEAKENKVTERKTVPKVIEESEKHTLQKNIQENEKKIESKDINKEKDVENKIDKISDVQAKDSKKNDKKENTSENISKCDKTEKKKEDKVVEKVKESDIISKKKTVADRKRKQSEKCDATIEKKIKTHESSTSISVAADNETKISSDVIADPAKNLKTHIAAAFERISKNDKKVAVKKVDIDNKSRTSSSEKCNDVRSNELKEFKDSPYKVHIVHKSKSDRSTRKEEPRKTKEDRSVERKDSKSVRYEKKHESADINKNKVSKNKPEIKSSYGKNKIVEEIIDLTGSDGYDSETKTSSSSRSRSDSVDTMIEDKLYRESRRSSSSKTSKDRRDKTDESRSKFESSSRKVEKTDYNSHRSEKHKSRHSEIDKISKQSVETSSKASHSSHRHKSASSSKERSNSINDKYINHQSSGKNESNNVVIRDVKIKSLEQKSKYDESKSNDSKIAVVNKTSNAKKDQDVKYNLEVSKSSSQRSTEDSSSNRNRHKEKSLEKISVSNKYINKQSKDIPNKNVVKKTDASDIIKRDVIDLVKRKLSTETEIKEITHKSDVENRDNKTQNQTHRVFIKKKEEIGKSPNRRTSVESASKRKPDEDLLNKDIILSKKLKSADSSNIDLPNKCKLKIIKGSKTHEVFINASDSSTKDSSKLSVPQNNENVINNHKKQLDKEISTTALPEPSFLSEFTTDEKVIENANQVLPKDALDEEKIFEDCLNLLSQESAKTSAEFVLDKFACKSTDEVVYSPEKEKLQLNIDECAQSDCLQSLPSVDKSIIDNETLFPKELVHKVISALQNISNISDTDKGILEDIQNNQNLNPMPITQKDSKKRKSIDKDDQTNSHSHTKKIKLNVTQDNKGKTFTATIGKSGSTLKLVPLEPSTNFTPAKDSVTNNNQVSKEQERLDKNAEIESQLAAVVDAIIQQSNKIPDIERQNKELNTQHQSDESYSVKRSKKKKKKDKKDKLQSDLDITDDNAEHRQLSEYSTKGTEITEKKTDFKQVGLASSVEDKTSNIDSDLNEMLPKILNDAIEDMCSNSDDFGNIDCLDNDSDRSSSPPPLQIEVSEENSANHYDMCQGQYDNVSPTHIAFDSESSDTRDFDSVNNVPDGSEKSISPDQVVTSVDSTPDLLSIPDEEILKAAEIVSSVDIDQEFPTMKSIPPLEDILDPPEDLDSIPIPNPVVSPTNNTVCLLGKSSETTCTNKNVMLSSNSPQAIGRQPDNIPYLSSFFDNQMIGNMDIVDTTLQNVPMRNILDQNYQNRRNQSKCSEQITDITYVNTQVYIIGPNSSTTVMKTVMHQSFSQNSQYQLPRAWHPFGGQMSGQVSGQMSWNLYNTDSHPFYPDFYDINPEDFNEWNNRQLYPDDVHRIPPIYQNQASIQQNNTTQIATPAGNFDDTSFLDELYNIDLPNADAMSAASENNLNINDTSQQRGSVKISEVVENTPTTSTCNKRESAAGVVKPTSNNSANKPIENNKQQPVNKESNVSKHLRKKSKLKPTSVLKKGPAWDPADVKTTEQLIQELRNESKSASKIRSSRPQKMQPPRT